MRPCNKCGSPIANSASLCESCSLDQKGEAPPADTGRLATPAVAARTPVTKPSSSWPLVLFGGLLQGLPVALVMVVASQIVTAMPLTTSCLLGLGVGVAVGLVGAVAELLPTGGRKIDAGDDDAGS